MDKLTDILEAIFILQNDPTAGAIPGCDCGCGGDSYDWDSIYEDDRLAQETLDKALEHLPFDQEDLERMARDWDQLWVLPNPSDEWYTSGDGNYEDDLECHAKDVDEYGYHIAWAINELWDFDWTLLGDTE